MAPASAMVITATSEGPLSSATTNTSRSDSPMYWAIIGAASAGKRTCGFSESFTPGSRTRATAPAITTGAIGTRGIGAGATIIGAIITAAIMIGAIATEGRRAQA